MSLELLNKLFAEVEKNNLCYQRSEDGLILFDYTRECQYSSNWNDVTLMARGLVLEESTGKIVARPLPKFFNYGEGSCRPETLPNEPFIALDKLDGSCGICFHYKDSWRVCTRGSFKSDQAIWATEWLHRRVRLDRMNEDCTYIFEIIYPENKIVIDYGDFSGLVLLACRYRSQIVGGELGYVLLSEIATNLGVRIAEAFRFDSLTELLAEKSKLGKNREGFVIWYPKSGYRFKLKGDIYCHLHRMISNLTPLAFWGAMDLETLRVPKEFLVELPEEFREIADQLQTLIEGEAHRLLNEVREISERMPTFDNNKDRYFWITNKVAGWPLQTASLLLDYTRGSHRRVKEKIHRIIRPTGNFLQGFTPSDRVSKLEDG